LIESSASLDMCLDATTIDGVTADLPRDDLSS
jgi:hypothetical protein